MGFSVKVAPGVRVRASSRGVRTSLGPRAVRIHVGGGRPGISTGAGPVTFYTTLGGHRRGSAIGAATRPASPSPAAQAKAAEAQRLAEVFEALGSIHHLEFDQARPPVAPPPAWPDPLTVHRRHEKAALAGVSPFKRAERAAARQRAQAAAIAELWQVNGRVAVEHQRLQGELDALWAALCGNDPDVVLATLEQAFKDNDAPAAAVGVDGAEASIVMLAPDYGIVPERMPGTTAAGNLSLRKLPKGERAALYTRTVFGLALVTLREAFAVAPGLRAVRLVVLHRASADAYGNTQLDCVLAGRWTSEAFERVRWRETDAQTIAEQTASDLLTNVRAGKELRPVDLSHHPDIGELVKKIDSAELLTGGR